MGILEMIEQRNRIMIFGPKSDGTYVIEFRTAAGEALAISIPASEAAVIKHFQERMPYPKIPVADWSPDYLLEDHFVTGLCLYRKSRGRKQCFFFPIRSRSLTQDQNLSHFLRKATAFLPAPMFKSNERSGLPRN